MIAHDDTQIEMYRKMLLIRVFEEQARDFFMKNVMRGSTHMYIGQEAIAVGVCAALEQNDYITSTHRGHGHLLAKGGNPDLMMAELLGKANGYCKGKGGSMHIADLSIGNLGANGIVGGGIGLATGAAFACYYRDDGRVAVSFFGDGAINQGVFYECANMAALWKLPVIYVCERNRFAEFSYTDRYFADSDLTKRAIPFGFPAVAIDGNDVLKVYETAAEAVKRARIGQGPTLIVANTYRIMGHTIGDPLNYRIKGEVETWQTEERDPILRFEKHLIQQEIASIEQLQQIKADVHQRIEHAAQFALNSPEPPPSALWEDIYA
ncbi:MAG: pyruvate dehydrogenase (acetyl-transferring) E1 component subunit alpha [Anaerolineae bacterium]|nr:pyruvate dehydrogenase (acetyl-transferring) E1 component subunit alpha [Anaerolineae bacterium]